MIGVITVDGGTSTDAPALDNPLSPAEETAVRQRARTAFRQGVDTNFLDFVDSLPVTWNASEIIKPTGGGRPAWQYFAGAAAGLVVVALLLGGKR